MSESFTPLSPRACHWSTGAPCGNCIQDCPSCLLLLRNCRGLFVIHCSVFICTQIRCNSSAFLPVISQTQTANLRAGSLHTSKPTHASRSYNRWMTFMGTWPNLSLPLSHIFLVTFKFDLLSSWRSSRTGLFDIRVFWSLLSKSPQSS